jgi:CheY-like chemotaxis protein
MRILIADDNEVSLRFLAGACRSLGFTCIETADGGAAIEAAARDRFDAMLLDLRMPVAGGAEVLRELRTRGIDTIAIATTADLTPALAEKLRSDGFADAIDKPISIVRLAQVLRNRGFVASESGKKSSLAHALLDDASALAVIGGDRITLRALRKLLAAELEIALDVDVASGEQIGSLRDRLHRLRASCGFCGATTLAESAFKLESALTTPENASSVLAEFLAIRAATLDVLIQSDSIQSDRDAFVLPA